MGKVILTVIIVFALTGLVVYLLLKQMSNEESTRSSTRETRDINITKGMEEADSQRKEDNNSEKSSREVENDSREGNS